MSVREATMALSLLIDSETFGPSRLWVTQSSDWPSKLWSASIPSVAKWTLRPPVVVEMTAS